MTYRFGRIAKVWLRRTGVPHPNWTGRPDVDPVMYEPREMIDPEASTERVYAAVPGLPETYGSLGLCIDGDWVDGSCHPSAAPIWPLGATIRRRRLYADQINEDTRPTRTPEKKKMTYKFGRIPKRRYLDSLRGMTPYEPQAAPKSTFYEKALATLHYTISNPKALANFQRDYNLVSKYAKQISGQLVADNTPDKKTHEALLQAMMFQEKMPKTWVHYVKKFKHMEGEQEYPSLMKPSGPKEYPGPGKKRPRLRLKRRRGRRSRR